MKRNEIRANLLFLLVSLLLGIALFFATIPINIIPMTKIEVVDVSGRRVPGVEIRQISMHYTFELGDHQEYRTSDANGFAVFPERKIRVSPVWYVVARIWTFVASINPHASSRPSAFYLPKGFSGSAGWNERTDNPIRLVLNGRTT